VAEKLDDLKIVSFLCRTCVPTCSAT